MLHWRNYYFLSMACYLWSNIKCRENSKKPVLYSMNGAMTSYLWSCSVMASTESVENGVAYLKEPPQAIPFPKAASKSWPGVCREGNACGFITISGTIPCIVKGKFSWDSKKPRTPFCPCMLENLSPRHGDRTCSKMYVKSVWHSNKARASQKSFWPTSGTILQYKKSHVLHIVRICIYKSKGPRICMYVASKFADVCTNILTCG